MFQPHFRKNCSSIPLKNSFSQNDGREKRMERGEAYLGKIKKITWKATCLKTNIQSTLYQNAYLYEKVQEFVLEKE